MAGGRGFGARAGGRGGDGRCGGETRPPSPAVAGLASRAPGGLHRPTLTPPQSPAACQAWWEEATPQTLCLLGELVQALPATVGAPLVATLVRDRVWGPGTAAAEEGEGNWGAPSASTPSFSPLNPAHACGVLLVCEAALRAWHLPGIPEFGNGEARTPTKESVLLPTAHL